MTTRMFGAPVKRREDPRLVTGQGRYLDDLGHDALEAAFVRSPHAHARIVDVDASEAVDIEGVVGIYTWEDLPERMADPLPLLIPHPTLTHGRTGYALAKDEVNHVGEAVVMVVARDRYIAEDAAQRIVVTYDRLPVVVGLEQARAATELVHEDVPGNVAAHMVQEVGDVERALASSVNRLTLDLEVERSASMPMEGKGVYARWDDERGELRLWSSTQTSTGVRAAVAARLGLPLAKVECIAPDVGGGFGVKIMHPWPEEVLVSWTARMLGHPVKWTEDRREHFISSAHERGQLQHVEVGFDERGVVTALDVKFWHDNGAYTPYGIIVPIITSTQLLGPYKPGAYRCEFWSLYTNTVIVTPYRGAGRPQGCFLMERTMDAIADHLGLDRAEVRSRNFILPDEMPYDHGLLFQDGRPLKYDSGDFPASLDKLKALVGWDDFADYRAKAEAEGRRVGLGIGCYVEGTGVGPYEGGHVQVETSGRVNVSTGLTSQGQGHETAFAQVVAQELGVRVEDVHVTTGDTRKMPYAVGTFASRAAVMSGNAVALAARAVRAKALRIAAEALEVSVDDLDIVDGEVSVKGAPGQSISLGTISVLSNPLRYAFDEAARAATQFAGTFDPDKPPVADDDEPGLEGKDFYSPTQATFANGMHAAIVETDPVTAEIKILRYCVIHDCGPMINPMIVEGQVHGGVAQGVGGALYERMVYDEGGQLLNASFMDFLLPYASEVPHVETDHLETPSPLNPLGIKGAGEAGCIPVTAVIASAISDAEGFPITSMPISPAELWDLRRRHSAGDLPSLRHPHTRTSAPAELSGIPKE
ncbi:xanthine dehydrogenase [Intrasporangium chromatireducens Q5-1]|uniref:Xanthine dehydrogenase n=1 Tax=Intrasporangium chromatireducens Q5-1 TaxID=584657 RepID=W9GUB9_9MICO|nr:aerobic carbon-monoxide dehydrogenase large subunit [Intrasporangium chromatireducens]EWT07474.1 xanthine dehydrogenase [Intrasporangium chromatireducens Q5-1]